MISRLTTFGLMWPLVFMFIGGSGMAHSVEEPQYRVLDSIGNVEIRQYPPVVQAFTVLPGGSKSATGFRRLADFIFGGNDREQKIAMTAPVQESLGGEVTEMAFTMPGKYALEDLPRPTDDRVKLHNVPARTVAVVTFSGWASRSRVTRFEQELREALERDTIEVTGEALLNQFNPPWTLPFQRRNEIMIEVGVSGAR